MYPKDAIKNLNDFRPEYLTSEWAILEVQAIYEAREQYTLRKKESLFKIPEICQLFLYYHA